MTYKIFHILYPKLDENGLHPIYNLMRDAQHAIARMELAGVCLDKKSHGSLIALWRQKKIECKEVLRSYMGDDINLNSTKQIGDWISTQIPDVTKWPKTETGRLQVNASALAQNRDLPITEPLLKYKAVTKLLSTYGETFANHINPVTGRIHASFRLGGTATGRLSCSKPNIQNPPRDAEFRKLFIAEKGNVLVVADYSQIELRVAALVSGDEVMLESYRVGDDLHKKTAAAILGIDPIDVTKAQRQMAKAVNFGLLFGMGATGLSRYAKNSYGVNMSLKEATRAKKAFLNTYSGLSSWQKRTGNLSKALQKVITPMGRIRDFRKEVRGYKYTEALNTPVQGGAAEIMLCALIRLEKRLDWNQAKIVNIIHDEIIVECYNGDGASEEVERIVRQQMLAGFLDVFPNAAPFTKDLVACNTNVTWGNAK